MREVKWRWRPSMKPETVEDWTEVQEIEKDICFLYHQLAEYSYIIGDLYYGNVYSLPYWHYVNAEGLVDDRQREFIQNGCLVMILAMCWDVIDGSGAYVNKYLNECVSAVEQLEQFHREDEATVKLIQTVKMALRTVAEKSPTSKDLIELSTWVHKRYIRAYFTKTTHAFETSPYFKG